VRHWNSPQRIRPGEIEKLSKIAHYVDIQLLSHGVLANVTGKNIIDTDGAEFATRLGGKCQGYSSFAKYRVALA